jgi:hypothetical protein
MSHFSIGSIGRSKRVSCAFSSVTSEGLHVLEPQGMFQAQLLPQGLTLTFCWLFVFKLVGSGFVFSGTQRRLESLLIASSCTTGYSKHFILWAFYAINVQVVPVWAMLLQW